MSRLINKKEKMKKVIILIALIFSVSVTNAQYNKWAVEAEVGTHQVNSPSITSESLDDGIHLGVAGRYNFNPKFGVGLVGGFDNLTAVSLEGDAFNLDYYRVNVEAYVNIFKMLDLNPKRFTMLVHGGPGLSWIDTDTGYNERVENISGGITGLFKVNNRVALKLDFTSTGNIAQSSTVDGLDPQNAGISSTVHNISLGTVIYLGKKKDKKLDPHADWFVAPKDTLVSITNVTNVYPKEIITNIVQVEGNCDCDYISNEFVFFDHDKEDIKDTELNAIYKVYDQLRLNDNLTLIINGWASPTESSSEYNQRLSERRSNEVYAKYVSMGIDADRIRIESFGKDLNKSEELVYDVARRVELIIVKDN